MKLDGKLSWIEALVPPLRTLLTSMEDVDVGGLVRTWQMAVGLGKDGKFSCIEKGAFGGRTNVIKGVEIHEPGPMNILLRNRVTGSILSPRHALLARGAKSMARA